MKTLNNLILVIAVLAFASCSKYPSSEVSGNHNFNSSDYVNPPEEKIDVYITLGNEVTINRDISSYSPELRMSAFNDDYTDFIDMGEFLIDNVKQPTDPNSNAVRVKSHDLINKYGKSVNFSLTGNKDLGISSKSFDINVPEFVVIDRNKTTATVHRNSPYTINWIPSGVDSRIVISVHSNIVENVNGKNTRRVLYFEPEIDGSYTFNPADLNELPIGSAIMRVMRYNMKDVKTSENKNVRISAYSECHYKINLSDN